jgi:alanyl aminopeptidase
MTRSRICLVAAALGIALVACERKGKDVQSPAATAAEEPPPRGLLPEDVTPERYEIDLRVVPEEDRFSGEVRIAIRLARPRTSLWLHGRDLRVREARVRTGAGEVTGAFAVVGEEGLARITLPRPVGPGAATVHLTYDAPLGRQPRGLFSVREAGTAYAFTQFEPISARSCFPGFDEPRFKTPFDLSLTVKREHAAVANTAALGEEPVEAGMKRIRFTRTEPLPTYLVALAVGPFDVVDAPPIPPNPVRKRPVPLRGIALRGKGRLLAHALRETPEIVAALERYFGIPYPFNKLDLIALVEFSGAMEHPGAVTFQEWLLLVDPRRASIGQKRAFAGVTAHELAHQWFGNLVTMRWWDDVWLNESFATWMATRTVEEWRPSYKARIHAVTDAQNAMGSDSLVAARQIRQPIQSPHDIRNAFDSITYAKGGAVLRMFEHYLGASRFRDGIRRYLSRHRWQTATADDFLRALSEVSSPEVSAAFRTFLDQPGVPWVEADAACVRGKGVVTLRQSRFLPLGSAGDSRRSWQLPVCIRYEVAGAVRQHCQMLTAPSQRVELPDGCPAWIFPNAGGAGYYRFALGPAELRALRSKARGKLSEPEQLALADSLQAAFSAGRLTTTEALEALEPFSASPEPELATAPTSLVRFARDELVPPALRARVESYGRRLYAGRLAAIGFDPRPGDDENRRLLRKDLVRFLAEVARDPQVRRLARARGEAYLGIGRGGKIQRDAVDPDVAATALMVAIQEGGAAVFDAAVKHLSGAREPDVRRNLVIGIGAATDPALGRRVRALALDPKVRVNEIFTLMFVHFSQPENREATWQWLKENTDALLKRIPGFLASVVVRPAMVFCSEERRREVEAFFRPRVERIPGGPRALEQTLEAIGLCSVRRKHHAADARAFFERVGGEAP